MGVGNISYGKLKREIKLVQVVDEAVYSCLLVCYAV
jgi:hypothetical protein